MTLKITKLKRKPVYSHDINGTRIANVSLAKGHGIVELHAEDFEALLQSGFSGNLCLNHNNHGNWYVRASQVGGNTVSVARLVTRAGRHQVVRYRDGNRLNLRRSNLYLDLGRSKMDCSFVAKIREGIVDG